MAFYLFGRYRYPLVPIAMLFAGAAAVAIPSIRRAPRMEWAAPAFIVVVVAILSHIHVAADLADTTSASDW